MQPATRNRCVLTINSGSSSIKFALYREDSPATQLLSGKIERIGLPRAVLTVHDGGKKSDPRPLAAPNHKAAGDFLIKWLGERLGSAALVGVGHRVVHGGLNLIEPQRVTPRVLAELRRIRQYVPKHLPAAIALMEVFHRRYPRLTQVACFDTAFHHEMPRVAKLLPLPR